MSYTKPIENVAVSVKHRTWRVQIECPNGGTPVIQGFREAISLDSNGVQIGESSKSMEPFSFSVTPETLLTIPEEYRNIPSLLSSFFDWMEQTNETGSNAS